MNYYIKVPQKNYLRHRYKFDHLITIKSCGFYKTVVLKPNKQIQIQIEGVMSFGIENTSLTVTFW